MRPVLRIRQASQTDLAALLDLYQQLIPDDSRPSPEQSIKIFERFLTYQGSAIFLGEIDERLVATCTLVVIPNLTRGGSPYGLIENVVTDFQFRQQGYGKQLLDAATVVAWNYDCYKVMLSTGSKEPGTIAFYLGAGFTQTRTGFQKRRILPRI
jgi:GNAT superfamily N-acetyltransferase